MNARITALSNVGGNWCPPHCAYLTWPNFELALRTAELIAEDHSFTFKTTEQRFNGFCRLPYGPKVSP